MSLPINVILTLVSEIAIALSKIAALIKVEEASPEQVQQTLENVIAANEAIQEVAREIEAKQAALTPESEAETHA